jgi:hypothetical protein
MTKSDFGLWIVRPIFVAALICSYPDGRAATWGNLPHYLLSVAFLTLPLALMFLSGKRAG